MKEIIYKYNNRGLYQTEQDTSFNEYTYIKITVEPHQFSMAIGNEVLRSTSFDGCIAIVSCEGEVTFYDNKNNIIAKTDKSERCFEKVNLKWETNMISIQFGHISTVDYYPNCDGEFDRWGQEWVTEREVTLNFKNNSIEIK